jgi:hypothetical protein
MTLAPTPILRLTQTGSQDNRHTIQLEWLGDGPRQVASAIVDLALTEQDQQDIRWYVEEYAEYPFDPYPAACVASYQESYDLALRIGEHAGPQPVQPTWGMPTRGMRFPPRAIWRRPRSGTSAPWMAGPQATS